jgi:ABC-2 type transport system permease protein
VKDLVGTRALTRLILRRDRLRLTVWVLALSLLPIGTASAFAQLYPTEAERVQLVASVASTPALLAFLGPLYDPSIGGLTVWRSGTLVATLAGLMAVLTVIRHTRDDEETGRRELLGATVLGRGAPLVAVLLIVSGAGAVIGAAIFGGMAAQGESVAGSIAFGLAVFGVVISFAAVGAVAAQMTESASTARGLGVAAVAVAFLLRVAGDGGESVGIGWMTWLSPIGWFSRIRAYADERWWVLGFWVVFAVGVGWVAFSIMARRDIGAGVLASKLGPERAARALKTSLALAWRLHRGSLLGWTLGLAAMGVVFGAVGESVTEVFGDNPQLAAILEAMGGVQGITDTFFSAVVGMLAIVASAYSIRAVLRLRVEEEELRVEPILATATPRLRWATSHLLFGILGPVIMLTLSALVIGVSYGAVVGDIGGQATRILGSALVQLPAVWVLTGLAMALFGLAPGMVTVSWGVLVAVLIVGQFGEILQFPQWVINLSPFSHIPLLPAEDFELLPMALLGSLAVVLVIAGLIGTRNRDIPSI